MHRYSEGRAEVGAGIDRNGSLHNESFVNNAQGRLGRGDIFCRNPRTLDCDQSSESQICHPESQAGNKHLWARGAAAATRESSGDSRATPLSKAPML